MERRKLTKEDINKVRGMDGFPIATDEDIITLSDAPFYTACPNPFVEDFVKENGIPYDEAADNYHREPFASDVSEGKKDPVYNAHSYHTKVPYKAIMRYILHYTKPGDIVFDGFCGTGMTGIAAQMCGTNDRALEFEFTGSFDSDNWGTRKAVVSDLAPVATYLSELFNTPVDTIKLKSAFEKIVAKVNKECSWMYETETDDGKTHHVNYTVFSDVFICPHCGQEIVFWDCAVDKESGSVKTKFPCSHCGAELAKKDCERAIASHYDTAVNEIVSTTKQVPVLIAYEDADGEHTKEPSSKDLDLISRINEIKIPYWYPTDLMMGIGEKWGDSWRAGYHQGMTRIHHFFTHRNLYVIAALWDAIKNSGEDQEMKIALMSVVTGVMQGVSKLQRFRLNSGFPNMILSGTLYVGSMIREWNVLDWIQGKYRAIAKLKNTLSDCSEKNVCISTNSLTQTSVPDNSIDYVFTDPPFGDNLMYSELSFMWEAWLKPKTNNVSEAIINSFQAKGLLEYQGLMTQCFREYYRVLKPGHWMTVEFHNSKNAVWNAIQESLGRAGFIIADVRTLDKQQSSYTQIKNTSAVKQDLVISAYKPREAFTREFQLNAGSEETAWAFVQQHLSHLPIVVDADGNGKLDVIVERQAFLLFDRMIAYHIMNGLPVPLDSGDFYRGLDERFLLRDGMYFLPDQVNVYDTARIKMEIEPIQFSLFVTNEKTAISWLYQQLSDEFGGPQTYAEIQPKFMQEVKSVDRYEAMPELAVLLEENFLQDEKGRWYIPDVTKEGDVTKLREKKLWKEFEGYMNSKGKLKLFRSEAIRVGFSRLWKDKNYQAIVNIANRLPEQTIQEDPNLLMYYDISLSRV